MGTGTNALTCPIAIEVAQGRAGNCIWRWMQRSVVGMQADPSSNRRGRLYEFTPGFRQRSRDIAAAPAAELRFPRGASSPAREQMALEWKSRLRRIHVSRRQNRRQELISKAPHQLTQRRFGRARSVGRASLRLRLCAFACKQISSRVKR
jgi:hypothetical protein